MKTSRALAAFLLGTAIVAAPLAAPTVARADVALQSFAPLVKEAMPAVVTVMTTGRTADADMAVPEGMEDYLERFFGDRGMPMPEMPSPRSPRGGIGSGFIISEDGLIVTNNHVVAGAGEITVRLTDGSEYDAELVGRDNRVDLAVLRIAADDALPALAWGESDDVEVGDWTLAIGNPMGLNGTVTMGIVSARGRDINSGPYDDYLQVDAAINRGNSGGPLFNLDGEVIGVNTAILSPTGGNVGLGFAIPAAQAQDIVAELIEDGRVDRGWIGVSIQAVTPEIAGNLGLDDAEGALVAEVMADSPAEDAGLQAGDVILAFDGEEIDEIRDLTRAVADHEVGEEADMEIWRGNRAETIEITPALLETSAVVEEEAPAPMPASLNEVPELGLSLEENVDAGLAVLEVQPDTPAARGGLQSGDVLISANQAQLGDADALRQVVREAQETEQDTLLVLVERDGARRFLTLDLAEA